MRYPNPCYAMPLVPTMIKPSSRKISPRMLRVGILLLCVTMVLMLMLPLVTGFIAYKVLGHYDVLIPMQRVWIGVGIGLLTGLFLQMAVMFPLSLFVGAHLSQWQEDAPEVFQDLGTRALLETMATQRSPRRDDDANTCTDATDSIEPKH